MKFTVKHAIALLISFIACIAIATAAKFLFNENVYMPVILGGLFVFVLQFAKKKEHNPTKNV